MLFPYVCAGVLFLFLLWLFLAAPAKRREKTERAAAVLYAHRGLHGGGVPENSLAAFRRAMEAGCGIELDVQLSRDGVPIVFHDESLIRLCGRPERVSELTAAELSSLTLGESGERIPTLSEALSLVSGRVPLLIELKYYRKPVRVAAETAALLDRYGGEAAVESFHPLALRWFRRNRPETVRGLLAMDFFKKRENGRRKPYDLALHLFLTNFLSRPDFIAYDLRHRGAMPLRLLCRVFRPVLFGWTARCAKERETKGFDTFIFEEAADCREGETT